MVEEEEAFSVGEATGRGGETTSVWRVEGY